MIHPFRCIASFPVPSLFVLEKAGLVRSSFTSLKCRDYRADPLGFHSQIKILLGLDILRCKSPELIEKETIMHLIAYNLIRLLMQQAARTHAGSLGRISFKGALDTVRHFAAAIHAARATPRKQDALIDEMLAIIAADCVPERPGRSEPRAKKRRAKNYHLLTKPRAKMHVPPHRNRPRPVIHNAA
jgi:hypothetical protein